MQTAHFTVIGWLMLLVLLMVAMAWAPSRQAVLWLLGLVILGMIVLNAGNFKQIILAPSATASGS